MRAISRRWLKQTEADLQAAIDSLSTKHCEWSCFQAQQSGDKALKAYLHEKGYTSITTNSLRELIQECVKLAPDFQELYKEAKTLDMQYIPTRYPNGLAGNAPPAEFYEKEDAEKCISCVESILKTARKFLKE